MKKTGFYIIKDDFFAEVNDPYLKGNKEQNRPHYYCFEDSENGIYWMIPLSSRIDKYQRIIDKRLAAGKPCDTLYIVELDNNRKNVFLIQDIFPITADYIEREYTIAGKLKSVPGALSVCSNAASSSRQRSLILLRS